MAIFEKSWLPDRKVQGLFANKMATLGTEEKKYHPENVMTGILKHKDASPKKTAIETFEKVMKSWSKELVTDANANENLKEAFQLYGAEIKDLSLDKPTEIATFIKKVRIGIQQIINPEAKAKAKDSFNTIERELGSYLATKYMAELVSKEKNPKKIQTLFDDAVQKATKEVAKCPFGTESNFHRGIQTSSVYQLSSYLPHMHETAVKLDNQGSITKKSLLGKNAPGVKSLESYVHDSTKGEGEAGQLEIDIQKQCDINKNIIMQEVEKETKEGTLKDDLKNLVFLHIDTTRLKNQIQELKREEQVILQKNPAFRTQLKSLKDEIQEHQKSISKLDSKSPKKADEERQINLLENKIKQLTPELLTIHTNIETKQEESTKKQKQLTELSQNKELSDKAKKVLETVSPKLAEQYYKLDLLEKEKQKAQEIIGAKTRLKEIQKVLDHNPEGYYSLDSMSDKMKVENGKFYVRMQNDKIEYTVINPNGKKIIDTITKEDLEGVLSEKELTQLAEDFEPKKLEPFLPKILNITSQRGHTQSEIINPITIQNHNEEADRLLKLLDQHKQTNEIIIKKELSQIKIALSKTQNLGEIKELRDRATNLIETLINIYDKPHEKLSEEELSEEELNKEELSKINKELRKTEDPDEIKELVDSATDLAEELSTHDEIHDVPKAVTEISEITNIIDNLDKASIPDSIEFDQASQDHETTNNELENFKNLVASINEDIGKLQHLKKRMVDNPSLSEVHSEEVKRVTRDLDAKMKTVKRMLPAWGMRYFSLRNVSLNPLNFNLLPTMRREGTLSPAVLQTMPEIAQLVQGLKAIDDTLHGSSNKQYDNRLDRKLGENLSTWLYDCSLDIPTYDPTLAEKLSRPLGTIKWNEYVPPQSAGFENSSFSFSDYFATTKERTIDHGEGLTGNDILAVLHEFNKDLIKKGEKPGEVTRWNDLKKWWKGSDGITISFPDDRGHEGHAKFKAFMTKVQEYADKLQKSKENKQDNKNNPSTNILKTK